MSTPTVTGHLDAIALLRVTPREFIERGKDDVKLVIALTAEQHPSISADDVYDIASEALERFPALAEILAHLPDEQFDAAFNAGRA